MNKRLHLLIVILGTLLLSACDSGPDTSAERVPDDGGSRIRLNDTGMDWCANLKELYLDCPEADHPGQDAESGRDLLAKQGKLQKIGAGHAGFDFTKLDKNGESLPADAAHWACVRDNHTGLEWEVKTTDGGLQHHRHTYSWYNPDPTRNGGDPGLQNGGHCKDSPCDTLGYTEAINQRGLCGRHDWRVPSTIELNSIVDFSREGPALDTGFFPNEPIDIRDVDTMILGYWSADQIVPKNPDDPVATSAVIVNVYPGITIYSQKISTDIHLRLVRGGA